MIVVIQCAASKAHNAGHLLTPAGTPVTFVAHPEIAPAANGHVHARPDDDCGGGKAWRQMLQGVKSRRTLFYSSAQPPAAPGCMLAKFDTKTRTNWHYEGANAFLDRSL